MTLLQFFQALCDAQTPQDCEAALLSFTTGNDEVRWVPLGGKENNRGPIEIVRDAGRAIVERITNAIDAVLEAEHLLHGGMPECGSPREAAMAWLNVPAGGLSEMTQAQRRMLAQRVTIRLLEGEGRAGRTIEVRDLGIGLTPDEMPTTILGLNESNKIQKYYVAGLYGQGGSSTFAFSDYTFIASRRIGDERIGFSVVKYLDLPPEEYKTGHYVYLTLGGRVPHVDSQQVDFDEGTWVKHFGYDLSEYPSPVGPRSLYGLLGTVLFDPILPVWYDSRVHDDRRTIKGARNALYGALDEGETRGPSLSHGVRMFHVSIGEYGRVGIEYWVLDSPSKESKNPIAAFVNPRRPIVLTLHGQNHAELHRDLVTEQAGLPYLAQRLVVHVNCDFLSSAAKRMLLASSREEARRGVILSRIEEEVVHSLQSDDELNRLNQEARERSLRQQDETATAEMRREVARLLRLHGYTPVVTMGGGRPSTQDGPPPASRPGPRPRLQPLELHEPPTYIRIVWDSGKPIAFTPGQRRYIRIETDADSRYHRPDRPDLSRMNVIVTGEHLVLRGTTPLQGGRLRLVLDADPGAAVMTAGTIRVELTRQGLPVLSDEKPYMIVAPLPAEPKAVQGTFPEFEVYAVRGPDDEAWGRLGWPDDAQSVACSAVMESGKLVVYYSTVFSPYAKHIEYLQSRDTTLAETFTRRYEIWLVVHSLLIHRDREAARQQQSCFVAHDAERSEDHEREERRRAATLSALFAAREVRDVEGLSATG